MPPPIGTYHAVAVLNRALEADREAISALVETRIQCNEALANDPTIQVLKTQAGHKKVTYRVGLIGVINGVLGVDKDGWGFVAAEVDDATHIVQKFVVREDDESHIVAKFVDRKKEKKDG